MAITCISCTKRELGVYDFNVSMDSMPKSLRTINTGGDYNSYLVLTSIHLGLVKYNNRDELVPSLASSWSIDKHKKAYTFFLRKNITFHDGSAVNCKAVKGSLEFVGLEMGRMPSIREIKCVNSVEVKIFLKTLNVQFITWLASLEASILPFKKSRNNEIASLVGAGPYKIKAIRKSEIVISKNTKHFSSNEYSPLNVNFRYIKSYDKAFKMFQAGSIDWMRIGADDVGNLPYVESDVLNRLHVLAFGQKLTAKNRSCLAGSIDKQLFASNLRKKGITVEPIHGLVSPAHKMFEKIIRDRTEGESCVDKVEVIVIDSLSPTYLVESLKNMIKPYSSNIQITTLPKGEFIQKLFSGDYDVAYFPYYLDNTPDFAMTRFFENRNGVSALVKHQNKQIYSYLDEMKKSQNKSSRNAAIDKIQKYIVSSSIIAPLVITQSRILLNECYQIKEKKWRVGIQTFKDLVRSQSCLDD